MYAAYECVNEMRPEWAMCMCCIPCRLLATSLDAASTIPLSSSTNLHLFHPAYYNIFVSQRSTMAASTLFPIGSSTLRPPTFELLNAGTSQHPRLKHRDRETPGNTELIRIFLFPISDFRPQNTKFTIKKGLRSQPLFLS
jgi:hypothetical protein